MFLWAETHMFDHLSWFRFNFIHLAEFKECFSLYDKKQKGKIDAKNLITVMRCLGTSPTIGEIERHLQVHKIGAAPTHSNNQNIPTGGFIVLNYVYVLYLCSEKSGELDFSTFLTMMHRQMQQEDPEAEIFEAFRMTDKQKRGFIQASELRAKLTTLGEKLTNKEGKMPWWSSARQLEKNVPSVHPGINIPPKQ